MVVLTELTRVRLSPTATNGGTVDTTTAKSAEYHFEPIEVTLPEGWRSIPAETHGTGWWKTEKPAASKEKTKSVQSA